MIGLIGGALVVTACAGSDSTSSDPTPAPVTEAPPETTAAPTESTEAPAAEPAPETTSAPEPEPEADAEEPPAEPEPTTTLAPEPVAAPLGGRELGQALRPESATGNNPLPDLLVDDVPRGTQVQLANVFPAQLPVLIWAWAPH